MPWTGGAFLIGSMAIAGLPPLNGFASEWLTLQALLHLSQESGTATVVAGALAMAGLAATAALAVYCFVKVTGLVLLGQPRRRACADAVDLGADMRWPVAFLAALCVALGVLPALLVPTLAGISGAPPLERGALADAAAQRLAARPGASYRAGRADRAAGRAARLGARRQNRHGPADSGTDLSCAGHPRAFTKPLRIALDCGAATHPRGDGRAKRRRRRAGRAPRRTSRTTSTRRCTLRWSRSAYNWRRTRGGSSPEACRRT